MKAFIIYKDFASALKANAVLQSAAQPPDFRVQWDIRPWRVDMLKFPPIAEEALADAVDAHLILFAGRCVQSVPFWLQDWLENWARHRHTGDAALAVMGEGNVDALSESAARELSQFARQHGLSFIVGDGAPPKVVEKLPNQSSPEPKLLMPPPQPGFIINTPRQESYRGWGIND
jgi:hypothetical protein